MNSEQFLHALLTVPRILNPGVSRDGKWVAWTALGLGSVADGYAAPTEGTAAPIRLTDSPERSGVVSWAPDSKSVIVTQDYHGNERFRLYRVDLDNPGKMVPLTEESPNYFLRGGQLHPNGRWLIYAANFDVETGQEIEPTWLYRQDLETGERIVLARPEKPNYYLPQLNDQGSHILYDRRDLNPSGRQVWLVDIEGKEDREILDFGPEAKTYASWFPDGRRVLVRAEVGTYSRLGVWDMAGGDIRWLVDDPVRNIEVAYVPHGSDRVVVIEVMDARNHVSLLDPETGEEQHLPEVPGNLVPLAPVAGGEWVGQYWSATQPLDIVRFSLDDVRPEAFTSIARVWEQTALRSDDLAPAEDFRWKSVDGLEIQGWLYRPRGEARGTVVYVHGGPTAHSQDRLDPEVQYYVSRGYNVLDPNYRGSTGFGIRFREAIKEDGWGGREQDDIRTGIEALIAAGIAQPGKVAITGTSYGGYSAWCAITHFPADVLAASAPVCGMTDLVVDYETTRPDLRPYSEEMMGGRPDQAPDRYFERSPINFVNNIKGKLMIVQGLQDPNVSPENVRTVERALQEAGVEYELAAFEDEGHGILRVENRKKLYPRLADFFEKAFAASDQ